MAWEYTVETIPLDHTGPTPNEILNALGVEGWELVSVVSQVVSGSIYVIFFLKRPLAEAHSDGADQKETDQNADVLRKPSHLPKLMKRRKE